MSRSVSSNRFFLVYAAVACIVFAAASFASAQELKHGAYPPVQIGNPAGRWHFEVMNDYECPASRAYFQKLTALVAKHPDDVLVTFRNAPLKGHVNAVPAAKAVEAAAAQGKAIEMMQIIYDNQDAFKLDQAPAETLAKYAKAIGLDTDRYALEVAGPIVADRLFQDIERARAVKLAGTPWILINDKVTSYGDAQDLEAIISQND